MIKSVAYLIFQKMSMFSQYSDEFRNRLFNVDYLHVTFCKHVYVDFIINSLHAGFKDDASMTYELTDRVDTE